MNLKVMSAVVLLITIGICYFINQSNKASAERLKQAEISNQKRLEQNKLDAINAEKTAEAERIKSEKAKALKAEQDRLISEKNAKEFEQSKQARVQAGIKKIEDKIKAEAFDAASAQFRNQKGNCGEVNAKNRFGGYVGFKRYIYDPKTDYVRVEGDATGYTPSIVIDALWKIECE
ncbi:hypothetical protein [Acinetobacter entericus]|uniref:Uncharacterized protein n=1 Tax=Acinetobacter entericus TaxID=2989714 RepID=A0ABT3NNK7_9GAMM|nr:hypothetical protein [Acinetobacter entericus]MCW8041132.1 hypothetical protein [Acinetobacter entericus]